MLINVLIRTSYRPKGFARALASVRTQTHKDIRIIVSYDRPVALAYIPEDVEKVKVVMGPGKYFYDCYCNTLKSMVTDGYFIFLDDDDYFRSPTVLERVIPSLSPDSGLIVQLKRRDRLFPADAEIKEGKIGMPCLILHHSHKNLADVPYIGAGDYHWIKSVSEQIPMVFASIVVVESDQRSNGRVER